MKIMDSTMKAAAVKFVRQAMKGEDWNDTAQYEMFSGWMGAMSPVTRAAFVETFGEAQTVEVESMANSIEDDMAEHRAASKGEEHRKEAMANEAVSSSDLKVGDFVFATGHGLKFDHENLHYHLRELIEFVQDKERSGDLVHTILAHIIRIEEVPAGFFDNDKCLEGWKPHQNEDGMFEGGCNSDDIADGDTRSWPEYEQWEKDSFYTQCVLIREPSGRSVLIDPEGYEYPRYLYYRNTWLNDFKPLIESIEAKIAEEKEAEAKAKAEKEAAELAAYNARCEKWEGKMAAPIDYTADYSVQTKQAKANMLAMAKAAFPGVRFTIRKSEWRGYVLSWTNGPTVEEMKEKADFDLFVGYVTHYDMYSDCHDTKDRKHATFAKKYGIVKDGIQFNRTEAETDRNRKVPEGNGWEKEPQPIVSGDGATVTENVALNGIEIRFATIPSVELRTELKENGFRWSKVSKCWYIRNTAKHMETAKAIAAKFVKTAA